MYSEDPDESCTCDKCGEPCDATTMVCPWYPNCGPPELPPRLTEPPKPSEARIFVDLGNIHHVLPNLYKKSLASQDKIVYVQAYADKHYTGFPYTETHEVKHPQVEGVYVMDLFKDKTGRKNRADVKLLWKFVTFVETERVTKPIIIIASRDNIMGEFVSEAKLQGYDSVHWVTGWPEVQQILEENGFYKSS